MKAHLSGPSALVIAKRARMHFSKKSGDRKDCQSDSLVSARIFWLCLFAFSHWHHFYLFGRIVLECFTLRRSDAVLYKTGDIFRGSDFFMHNRDEGKVYS